MKLLTNLNLTLTANTTKKNSIGKRFHRQDAIGTSLYLTVDYITLQDSTLIRYCDIMLQDRFAISDLRN